MSSGDPKRRPPGRPVLPPDPDVAAGWEVEHHLAELADRLVAEGMDRAEARREAERRFGDPHRYRAELASDERRRRTTMRWMTWWGVVTGGLGRTMRSMRREPSFTAGVVLTLALGIGANATMFGILDRLLFQPPAHVVDPGRVRRVDVERTFEGHLTRQAILTYPDYADFAGNSRFSSVAAANEPEPYTLGSGPDATRIRAELSTWTFFPLLGVRAERGRFYGPEEDRGGAAPTAVVSDEIWRSRMGADPDVIGRTLEISGHPFTIIGVAPRGFTGADLSRVDVWLPLIPAGTLLDGPGWMENRGWYWLRAFARLAPGVDVRSAEAEATAEHVDGRRAGIESGDYPKNARIALDPLILARGPDASGESKVARWLGGVSLIVLLIACANVANLLLVRGTRRRREVAVRLALGVDRARLVSTMVLESVLLALGGGAVGLLLAWSGGGIVRRVLLPGVLFPHSAVGERVALFTLAATLAAGLVAGVGPAIQATRIDIAGGLALGAGSTSARRSRTRALLTVLQAGLSVVLLVGAGLFLRSLSAVRHLDLGLDVDRLVTAELELQTPSLVSGIRTDTVPGAGGEQDRDEIYRNAMERLAALPGVVAVTGTSSPFQWAFAMRLRVPGRDSLPHLAGGGPYFQVVTPGYLKTVGIPLTRGRALRATDDAHAARVAVISATMARSVWPHEDPLGRCLVVGDDKECTTVVGVAEDASRGSLDESHDPFMMYYLPLAQRRERHLNGLYVRVSDDPHRVADRIAPVLRGLDPRIRYAAVRPLRELLDPEARSWTLGAAMFSVFGLLALVVAAVGLYSLLSFDVAQRRAELGIRTALGAQRTSLLGRVVASGVGFAALGVLLGLLTALVAGARARDLLFHVSPRDPLVLGTVAGVLLVVSLVASLVPAIRATRVDPMAVLRTE